MRLALLQLYRLGVVAAVAWLVRDVAVKQRSHGDAPVVVEEVRGFFPAAASLRPDDSERDGLFVLDRDGRELGYVVRTQPRCHDIIGYCGVTDTLVALGPDWRILGLRVRSSDDTKDHVRDVVTDRRFLKKWNGLTWDQAADLDFRQAGIEGSVPSVADWRQGCRFVDRCQQARDACRSGDIPLVVDGPRSVRCVSPLLLGERH